MKTSPKNGFFIKIKVRKNPNNKKNIYRFLTDNIKAGKITLNQH